MRVPIIARAAAPFQESSRDWRRCQHLGGGGRAVVRETRALARPGIGAPWCLRPLCLFPGTDRRLPAPGGAAGGSGPGLSAAAWEPKGQL